MSTEGVPTNPARLARRCVMLVWLWLACNFAGQIILRTSLAAETVEALIAVNWLYVVTLAIDVPLGILLVRLIGTLSSLQRHRLS